MAYRAHPYLPSGATTTPCAATTPTGAATTGAATTPSAAASQLAFSPSIATPPSPPEAMQTIPVRSYVSHARILEWWGGGDNVYICPSCHVTWEIAFDWKSQKNYAIHMGGVFRGRATEEEELKCSCGVTWTRMHP